MGYFTEEDKKELRKMKGRRTYDREPRGRRTGGSDSGRPRKRDGGHGLRHFSELSVPGRIWRVVWIALLILLAFLLFGVIYLTVTEFHPKATENVKVETGTSVKKSIDPGTSFSVLTWNVGYGALGDNADFFLDGGSSVKTASKSRVEENMENIVDEVISLMPDFSFFQEVDTKSDRSSRVDESALLKGISPLDDTTFAYNYRVPFVPYPVPPIGKVNAGIQTNSMYQVSDSKRIQLYSPFKWPESVGNLKRCLMVDRVPVTGTDKELVLVNLHLEAYDSGEGKAKQTAMLKDFLEKEASKGNYVVAAGDFNQTFSNADISGFKQLKDTWKAGLLDVSEFEGFQAVMDTTTPSCRSLDRPYRGADKNNFQYYSIDGFIVSDNITIDSVTTQDLGFKSADHNPVLLEAKLN